MGLMRRLIERALMRVGDAIDRFSQHGDPPAITVMSNALRRAGDRIAELSRENGALFDELDRMQLELAELRERLDGSGITLYRDEVVSLEGIEDILLEYEWGQPLARKVRAILTRADHCPLTQDEMTEVIHSAVMGHDVGQKFDPEVSPDGDMQRPVEIPPMSSYSTTPPPSCTCNVRFRTAEDWRDHLPCEGSAGK